MNKIYLRLGKNNIVEFIHRKPFDPVEGLHKTQEELEETGVFVSTIPEPNAIKGMRAVPYYNSDIKSVQYEYEAIKLTESERLDLIEGAINEILMSQGV